MTYSFVLRLFFSSSNLLPWSVGRYNLIWPIWGCATGQIMVFVLFTLNRVNNFAQVCPEQGIQFRQVWASPKQCPHSLSYSGSGFQTFGSQTYTQILVEYPPCLPPPPPQVPWVPVVFLGCGNYWVQWRCFELVAGWCIFSQRLKLWCQ